MARLRTREAFKQYVLHKLGYPLLDLVLQTQVVDECGNPAITGTTGTFTEALTGGAVLSLSGKSCDCPAFVTTVMTQLDLAVDDALDYFGRQGSGIGNETALLLLELHANRMVYAVPECIIAVDQPMNRGIRYNPTLGGQPFDGEESAAGANGLFSFEGTIGATGVSTYMTHGRDFDLLTMEVASEYMAMVDLRYSLKYQIDFNELEKQVIVYPTPSTTDEGRILAFECSRIVHDEFLFSNLWVQRYAVALTKLQIGTNLSMYTGFSLPGGGEFNASFYYDTGETERERLEEELMNGKYGTPTNGSVMLIG